MRRCSTRLTVSPRSNLVGVCECGFGHVPSLWGSLPCRTAMYVGSVGHSCLAVLRGRLSRLKAEIGERLETRRKGKTSVPYTVHIHSG